MSKAGVNETMRLVTRSDFDGLVCGALLKEAGVIDHWKFAHPKDLQDGLVEITAVSYTHLDVYKRQSLDCFPSASRFK